MSSLSNQLNTPSSHPYCASNNLHLSNGILALPRSRSPRPNSAAPEPEIVEDDARTLLFRDLFASAESKIDALFQDQQAAGDTSALDLKENSTVVARAASQEADTVPVKAQAKRPARTIKEDDYDEESEDEQAEAANNASPLKAKSTGFNVVPRVNSPFRTVDIPPSPALTSIQVPPSQWQAKSSDDLRKQLEEDKRRAEDAAKESFQRYFFPLDNDQDAMLEQQKLEESDRQVDMEMSGQGITNANQTTEGTLSQANLGTSSLVHKHLIARVDEQRQKVLASDQELRALLVEVRKNRSKWASEDRIGQEELYEAADKVLSEIKAMTEYSQPFLNRVNRRDAPDYYQGQYG